MLVRPGRVTTGAVYHAEDRIGADKVPWIDRRATLAGVASQFVRIDRVDPTVSARRAAVEQALIEIDALVVFGPCAVRRSRLTGTTSQSIASGVHGRGEETIVGNVVIDAHGARCGASHECHQTGKRIGRLGGG